MRRWVPGRFMRAILVWTACILLLEVIVGAEAIWSLYRADQACFFDYPNTPCPGIDDPALTRLTVAFVGIPLIWFVGTAAAFVARGLRHRRDDASRT